MAKTLTQTEAKSAGFRALAGPYSLDTKWMRLNVEADMKRGKIAYVLVNVSGGTEVWRTEIGMLEASREGSRLIA